MYGNNVKETSFFCQCFHKFLLIYNNVCLEKHQSGIIKKTKQKLKKSSEWYQNLTEEKKIKNMVMIDIRIS